jgi:hypothetical protein
MANTSINPERINLTPAEAASRLRMSKGSLANWRNKGQGPAFIKFNHRKVLYPLVELIRFEESRLRTSTSQAAVEGA